MKVWPPQARAGEAEAIGRDIQILLIDGGRGRQGDVAGAPGEVAIGDHARLKVGLGSVCQATAGRGVPVWSGRPFLDPCGRSKRG